MFGFFRKKPDKPTTEAPAGQPTTAAVQSESPDYSSIDSREKADALFRAGKLAKLFLRPPEMGGPDAPINTLYAPAGAVRQKSEIDLQVILPLAKEGKIRQYSAKAEYQGKSVVPTAITIEVSEPESYRFDVTIWGDARARRDQQWDEVYAQREVLYAQWFGTITGDVQKLMNLTGTWPGGCLVQIQAPRHNLWITSSFGLTNPDMPATTRPEEYAVSKSPDGRSNKYSMRLVGRPPHPIPTGRAGYGYEILLLTPQLAEWPLMFLNWSVNAEILRDADLLSHVHKYGALTIESVSLGNDSAADFLIAPAHSFAPPKADLPNGTMELLIATKITRPQMEFGRKNGGPALLKEIIARPQGQASI